MIVVRICRIWCRWKTLNKSHPGPLDLWRNLIVTDRFGLCCLDEAFERLHNGVWKAAFCSSQTQEEDKAITRGFSSGDGRPVEKKRRENCNYLYWVRPNLTDSRNKRRYEGSRKKVMNGRNIPRNTDWETEAKLEHVRCGSATDSAFCCTGATKTLAQTSLGGPEIDCQETIGSARE